MRAIFCFLCFLMIVSCESEGELTRREIGSTETDSTEIPSKSTLLFTGVFEPESGNRVTGTANIYKEGDRYTVFLRDFSVSSGPDLKVYLSKTNRPENFVNLGSLGSGNTQVYTVPKGVDFSTYNYVLIHCQQFNHLFAVAALKSN